MQLIRRFTEKEVLEIVVRHAVEEISGESKGKVHAKYTDNNDI